MFKTRKRELLNFETPQEMYDDYKNRKINGIQAYQSKMIDLYMEQGKDKSDVALELPTGTGKTLIGLLIGEFRRRKYKEKVVYVCPTSQLVYQTANYANETYGIKVIPFTGSKSGYETSNKLKYKTAECIAVTNYSSIFNASSFFEDADVMIFDDAHSGENYIASNWTVTIDRDKLNETYSLFIDRVKDILTDEQYRILTKEQPKTEDQTWCDMIHSAKLYDKYLIIQELLDSKLDETSQYFSWNNIKNNMKACNIYISWQKIVIRPYLSPTLTNNAFLQAKKRIYMSATLGKSGELERAYGIEQIHRLPMVNEWKNKDIGRRFFLFPLASLKKDEDVNIMLNIAKKANRALILVNNLKAQENIQLIFKEQKIGKTFNGKDIEKSKEEFINSNKAYAILANRLDGVDFPNDECRTEILFDLPTIAHIQEQFMITRLAAKTLFDERIRTRIIQALGRCTRGQTDYALVCVLSEEIMEYLLSPKNLERFNPELQAEIIFGQENSINKQDIKEYIEMMDVFLEHKQNWNEAEDGIISIREEQITKGAILESEAYKQLSSSAKYEVKLQYALWKQDYYEVLRQVDNILKILQAAELKGYRGYWYYVGGCNAFNLYKEGDTLYESKYKEYFKKASESTIAVNWFRFEELKKEKECDYMDDQIVRIEKMLAKEGKRGLNCFVKYLEEIKINLEKGGTDFERGHELLGYIGGYRATNPKGAAEPDPIWIVNRKLCIVSEDKIYTDGKLIPPNDVKEAAGHAEWIKNKADILDIQDDAEIITVFITTATDSQPNSTIFGKEVYYLNADELRKWGERLIPVIKDIYRTFSGEGDAAWRENTIKKFRENQLTPKDYIAMITKHSLKEI